VESALVSCLSNPLGPTSYAQIKELKRDKDDDSVKISPYSGDEHKFKIRGPILNDTVYNIIAERIIAARPH
jgi:hypothetical protein